VHDLRVHVEFDLQTRWSKGRSGRLGVSVEAPSVDFPATHHNVRIMAPLEWVSRMKGRRERLAYILASFDRAVEKYCELAGWVYPGPLPRTPEEQAWIAEHGEPVLPDWMDELVLPKRRKPRTAALEKALASLTGTTVEERAEEFVEHVRSVRASTAVSIIRGWWRLVDEPSTQAHWDAAEESMDDLGLSGDVFHDLRNYVALVDPDVARSGDPERFGSVVAAIDDFEDVGEAGAIADLLLEVIDERDLDVPDLPDLFAVRTD
jgi:hypothetical protein